MTKNQLKAKYQEYLKLPYRFVGDVYACPSDNKLKAELNIIAYMHDHHGYGYRVMSFNTSFFTVGYIIHNEQGKWFVYETAHNRYALQLY